LKCGKVLPGFRYANFAFLFFSALNFAHRNFVAFEIFALAAASSAQNGLTQGVVYTMLPVTEL